MVDAELRAAIEALGGHGAARARARACSPSPSKSAITRPKYLSEGRAAAGGRSGKLERITELLEGRYSGDKALVFTQYLEIMNIIEEHLRQQRV